MQLGPAEWAGFQLLSLTLGREPLHTIQTVTLIMGLDLGHGKFIQCDADWALGMSLEFRGAERTASIKTLPGSTPGYFTFMCVYICIALYVVCPLFIC